MLDIRDESLERETRLELGYTRLEISKRCNEIYRGTSSEVDAGYTGMDDHLTKILAQEPFDNLYLTIADDKYRIHGQPHWDARSMFLGYFGWTELIT